MSVGGGRARRCRSGALPSMVSDRPGPVAVVLLELFAPLGGVFVGAIAALGGSLLGTAFAPPGGTRLDASSVLERGATPGVGAGSGGRGARTGGALLRRLDIAPPVAAEGVASEYELSPRGGGVSSTAGWGKKPWRISSDWALDPTEDRMCPLKTRKVLFCRTFAHLFSNAVNIKNKSFQKQFGNVFCLTL